MPQKKATCYFTQGLSAATKADAALCSRQATMRCRLGPPQMLHTYDLFLTLLLELLLLTKTSGLAEERNMALVPNRE